MVKESEEEVEEAQVSEIYDLHIKVPREMQAILKKSAELAYKLQLTPKPELAELMNLFIGWGLTILKKHWLDRMGYK